MIINTYTTGAEVAQAAAGVAAGIIRNAISTEGRARILAATGVAHLPFIERLRVEPGVDWQRVQMFHLDEYVGLAATHPASFRKYLLERLIQPTRLAAYHLLDGEGDAQAVCREVGRQLQSGPIHVAFVGIGENGHLAFNDPPADFETREPYIIVELDQACRRQQVGEGWFPTIDDVPKQAITISIQQTLKAQRILAIVPERRKAEAVRLCLEGEIGPMAPASILRTHPDVTCFFDADSSSLLSPATLAQAKHHP